MYLHLLEEGDLFKLPNESNEYRVVACANFNEEQVFGLTGPLIELRNVVYAMTITYPEQLYKFHPEQYVIHGE